MKKSAGVGTALFVLFLIFVSARNDDGDWFTPGRKNSELIVPNPKDVWNSSEFIGDAQQVLVVAATDWNSTTADVALFEKDDAGSWKRVTDEMPARIGKNGISKSRSEGDGTTPSGSYRIGPALGATTGIDTKLRYDEIEPGDCWISEAGPDYNRWTTRPSCGPPNVDLYAGRNGAFEHAAVIDFNPQRVAGLGSALFVYQQTGASPSSTSGSVALSEGNLVRVLKELDAEKRPRIVIGPAEWLTGTASASSGSSSSWKQVSLGSTGELVRQVQYALTAAGYATKVDGTFAAETDANVRKFQADRKLKVDGVVGTETARALGLISGS